MQAMNQMLSIPMGQCLLLAALVVGNGQDVLAAETAVPEKRDAKPNDTVDTLRPGTWQAGVLGKSFNAVMNSRLLKTHPAQIDAEQMSGHRPPGPLQQLPLQFGHPELRGLVTLLVNLDSNLNVQQLHLVFPAQMLDATREPAMRALLKDYLAEMLQPENARTAQAVLEAPVAGEADAVAAMRSRLQVSGSAGNDRLQFADERLVALRIARGDKQVVILVVDHAGRQD